MVDADLDLDGSCFYDVLGIAKDASTAQVREAYRRLALKWHPDRWTRHRKEAAGEAKRRFQQIQQAYSVLSDGGKRTIYDAGLFHFLEDEDEGFSDFMQEMIFMMKTVEPQKGGNSFEELQGMLMGILTEDEKISMGFADLDPPTQSSTKRMGVTIFQ